MESRRPLRGARALCAMVLVAMACSSGGTVLAQDDAYRRLAEEATQAMAEHRLPEALTLFREMHAMAPSARTLWSLGRVHYEQGQYVVALDYLEQSLVDPRRPLEETALAEATSLRDRARALTAEVTAESSPPGALVLVDDVEMGAPTFRLDPGDHTLRFELAGHARGVRRIVVHGGEQISVRVVLTPLGGVEGASPPSMQREVTLEVASAEPGLRLHLQPLAVSGSAGALGPLQEICAAPCTHELPGGLYGGAVSRADGTPILAMGAMSLTTDSHVELELISHDDVRTGVGVAVVVGAVYAVVACIVGPLMLDSSNRGFYDSGGGIALVSTGITVGVLSLSALAFAFMGDEAAIRVAPR